MTYKKAIVSFESIHSIIPYIHLSIMTSSAFVVETPVWESMCLGGGDDADMMLEDNGSVIDGVVDDDFLMMLDDEDVDASLPGDNDHEFHIEDGGLGIDLNEDLTDNNEDDDFHQHQILTEEPRFQPLPPTRGVSRYHSEGIMPSYHHQRPQQTFSSGTGMPSEPRRGVSRHFSERATEPTRGVSRHFSERIPSCIPESTPSFYQHQDRPRSPVPNEINIFSGDEQHLQQHQTQARAAPTFRITPEAANSSISLPDPYALQVQYQRTLQRLGKSMRRSDATRSIVKRQRSGYSTCSNRSTESEVTGALAGDPHQVEEARQRLFHLISGNGSGAAAAQS